VRFGVWFELNLLVQAGALVGSVIRRQKVAVMDDAHKARLAQGRRDGAAVRAYLDYLEANRGRRGRPPVSCQHIGEELVGGADVASFRDVHIYYMAVLIDCSVHVASDTVDFDVRFVYEPSVTHGVTTRPGRVDEHRCEALYPPVDSDVVNFDAALGEEFFDIAIGESVAGVPADSQQDHLRREPVTGKRSGLNRAAAIHQHMLPSGA